MFDRYKTDITMNQFHKISTQFLNISEKLFITNIHTIYNKYHSENDDLFISLGEGRIRGRGQ